jgi:hypothetical protein
MSLVWQVANRRVAMRLPITFVAVAVSAVLTARGADPLPTTDETIIKTCGKPFQEVFAQFGTPIDIRVDRGDTPAEDSVFCDYPLFGFHVRNKKVRCCFIFPEWKGPIRGIKMGDTREEIAKVLGGNPRFTVKGKDGTISALGYDLKESGTILFANFSQEGRLERVEISLP